jgi:ribosomal protein S19E (S16A)
MNLPAASPPSRWDSNFRVTVLRTIAVHRPPTILSLTLWCYPEHSIRDAVRYRHFVRGIVADLAVLGYVRVSRSGRPVITGAGRSYLGRVALDRAS